MALFDGKIAIIPAFQALQTLQAIRAIRAITRLTSRSAAPVAGTIAATAAPVFGSGPIVSGSFRKQPAGNLPAGKQPAGNPSADGQGRTARLILPGGNSSRHSFFQDAGTVSRRPGIEGITCLRIDTIDATARLSVSLLPQATRTVKTGMGGSSRTTVHGRSMAVSSLLFRVSPAFFVDQEAAWGTLGGEKAAIVSGKDRPIPVTF